MRGILGPAAMAGGPPLRLNTGCARALAEASVYQPPPQVASLSTTRLSTLQMKPSNRRQALHHLAARGRLQFLWARRVLGSVPVNRQFHSEPAPSSTTTSHPFFWCVLHVYSVCSQNTDKFNCSPPKTAWYGGVIKNIKKSKKSGQTRSPLILWNVFVNVQLHILSEPREFICGTLLQQQKNFFCCC